MMMFNPREEVANFLRSMAAVGVQATVVWTKGSQGAATSNQGAEGLARATAALAIRGDAITRAAVALHKHMAQQPGITEVPVWDELDEGERAAIRTMCKIVLAEAVKPDPPPSKLASV